MPTLREIMAEPVERADVIGKPKLVANNTARYVRASGDTAWRLHSTDVVVQHVDGSWTLDSGGWKSPTTKHRINLYAPVSIGSDRGMWSVRSKGASAIFQDGMQIGANGELPEGGPDIAKQILATKKRIAKFIRKVDDGIPMPDSGDCWLCCMRSAEGKTMGEMGNDLEHLNGHIDEGYLHGSLIVNALRHKGYQDSQLPYVIRIGDIVKRSLRAYLGDKLGIGTKQAAPGSHRF